MLTPFSALQYAAFTMNRENKTVKVLLSIFVSLGVEWISCLLMSQVPALVFAAGAMWCRSSFHGSCAGNGEQLAGVHALIDSQLAAIPQHAYRYPGDVV